MERLNQLIEEYIMDSFENYRKEIDIMFKKNKEDINKANTLLFNWLVRNWDIFDEEEDNDICIVDWLRKEHNGYIESFMTEMKCLDMIKILQKIYIIHDNRYRHCILQELDYMDCFDTDNSIKKSAFIIDKYAYSYAYENMDITYENILKMIESRIIPK